MYEQNCIVKDWRKIDLSFGLIYPNLYNLGMSSYSIRLLYHIINSNERYVCERFFLPDKIRFPASKDYSIENLRSIENSILSRDFDILGFSVHFENDFKNILWILEKSRIPLNYKDRQEFFFNGKKEYPLIIGGGPAITSNPLTLSKLFDLFFIGDAEPNLNEFFEIFIKFKTGELTFQKFIKDVEKIEGIFTPSLNNHPKRAILHDLDISPNPTSQLISVSKNERKIFEENFFIEINRGCPYQCKFCISSFHNFPFRNRNYTNIINIIDEGIKHSKFEKLSLIGSCVSSHPRFYEICEYIINKKKKLSIPSIRIDHINPKIIHLLEKGNIKTITIAPETGSETLRYDLGKKISDDKILDVLKCIKNSSIQNVKFYFLVGLPNETDEDVDEIINLLKKIDKINFGRHRLKINVNPFIPKFNTPYQNKIHYFLSENLDNLKLKLKRIEKELKDISSIKLKFKNPKDLVNKARLQTLFSLGDQRVSELLIHYYLNGANLAALKKSEKEINFSIDNYFKEVEAGYRPWKI